MTQGNNQPKQKQSADLLKLTSNWGLFHSPSGEEFASIPVYGHIENLSLRDNAAELRLQELYFNYYNTPLNAQGLQEALDALKARARFRGPEHEVFLRVAGANGCIYLDLCNSNWEVVEIRPGGWRIISNPPVKFRRSPGMRELPRPVVGGSVFDLMPFVNISVPRDYPLLMSWLISSFFPKGPYPVLLLSGEHGAAKSTLARIAKLLIDPEVAPIRRTPKSTQDLMIASDASWVMAYDNVSKVSDWLSDDLCSIATGASFATRQLYTNTGQTLISVQRPVILNGIGDYALKPDLLDRSVFLHLPTIPLGMHIPEDRMWANFEALRPKILGAMLDALADALVVLPTISLVGLPRMADFGLRGTALERGLSLSSGTFLLAYKNNRDSVNERALSNSSLGVLILQIAHSGELEMEPVKLLTYLSNLAGSTSGKGNDLPRSPKSLRQELVRLQPILRSNGVEVIFGQSSGSNSHRTVTIKKIVAP